MVVVVVVLRCLLLGCAAVACAPFWRVVVFVGVRYRGCLPLTPRCASAFSVFSIYLSIYDIGASLIQSDNMQQRKAVHLQTAYTLRWIVWESSGERREPTAGARGLRGEGMGRGEEEGEGLLQELQLLTSAALASYLSI